MSGPRHTDGVIVAKRERDRLAAQVRDLRRVEQSEEAPPDAIRRTVDEANEYRTRHGRPPLAEHDDPPEAQLYARARALGLRRVRG